MTGKKLIVKRTLRKIISERKMNMGKSCMGKLEHELAELIRKAMDRAQLNNRTTVMMKDV